MKPKHLLGIGLLLVAIGAGLMIFNEISWKEKHEANVFGAELSVTTKEKRRIPFVVSGSLLGLGAILAVIGATRKQ